MADQKRVDSLSVIPDLVAELTALRGMHAILRDYLKAEWVSEEQPHQVAERVVQRLRMVRAETEAQRETMRRIAREIGVEANEVDILAWVRESKSIRKSVGSGEVNP